MRSKFEKRMHESIGRPWAIETEGRPPAPPAPTEEPLPAVQEPVQEPLEEPEEVDPDDEDLDEDEDEQDLLFLDEQDDAIREVRARLANLESERGD